MDRKFYNKSQAKIIAFWIIEGQFFAPEIKLHFTRVIRFIFVDKRRQESKELTA